MDRPTIHDRDADDPNKELFGELNDNGQRRLEAVVREHEDYYTVNLFYNCVRDIPPRGHFVTFITYPEFGDEEEDAYELFAPVEQRKSGLGWTATQELRPAELYTVAAIGDAGDTVLTLDLEGLPRTRWKPKSKRRRKGSGG
jgi:hypothetical protein